MRGRREESLLRGATSALRRSSFWYPAINKAISWNSAASLSTVQSHDHRHNGDRGEGGREETRGDDGGGSRLEEFPTDAAGWNGLFRELSKGYRGPLRNAYDDMVQVFGVRPDRTTFHILIPDSMRRGDPQDVSYFMKEMKNSGLRPDTILYNHCIRSATGRGDVNKAFDLAREMQSYGCAPNIKTLSVLMEACSQTGSYIEAQSIMNSLPDFQLEPDIYCYSNLMTAYGKSGLTNAVEKIYEVIQLAEQQAFETVERSHTLKHRTGGIESSEIGTLYQRAINVVADMGKPAAVRDLAKKMSEHGTSIDLDAYMIKAMAWYDSNSGDISGAVGKLEECSRKHIDPNTLKTILELSASIKGKPNAKKMLLKVLELIESADGWFIRPYDLKQLIVLVGKRLGPDGVECLQVMWRLLTRKVKGRDNLQKDTANALNRNMAIVSLRSIEAAGREGSEFHKQVKSYYTSLMSSSNRRSRPKTMKKSTDSDHDDGHDHGNVDNEENDDDNSNNNNNNFKTTEDKPDDSDSDSDSDSYSDINSNTKSKDDDLSDTERNNTDTSSSVDHQV